MDFFQIKYAESIKFHKILLQDDNTQDDNQNQNLVYINQKLIKVTLKECINYFRHTY